MSSTFSSQGKVRDFDTNPSNQGKIREFDKPKIFFRETMLSALCSWIIWGYHSSITRSLHLLFVTTIILIFYAPNRLKFVRLGFNICPGILKIHPGKTRKKSGNFVLLKKWETCIGLYALQISWFLHKDLKTTNNTQCYKIWYF